jgi:hypothetical protein
MLHFQPYSSVFLRQQPTNSNNALSIDKSNLQEIDKSKLQAISRGDSIYISLKNQRDAETNREGLQFPRHAVLREYITRIHFPIHHSGHWAAV